MQKKPHQNPIFDYFHWQQSTFIEADFPMADYNAFDSDLFCNEETKAFSFNDGDDDDDDEDHLLLQPFSSQKGAEKDSIFSNGPSDSEALVHLPCLSEECIGYMLEREREHLPRDDYLKRLRNGDLDVGLRREALDWMFKVTFWLTFLDFFGSWLFDFVQSSDGQSSFLICTNGLLHISFRFDKFLIFLKIFLNGIIIISLIPKRGQSQNDKCSLDLMY